VSEDTYRDIQSPAEVPSVAGGRRLAAPRSPDGARPPASARSRHLIGVAFFVVAVGLVLPRIVDSRSGLFLVNLWLVYSIAGIGFYWMFSLGSRFAFCQTFMMALGGYTSAWVTRQADGLPFAVGAISGVGAAAVVALLVGLAVRRTQHFYFAIATIAVSEVGAQFFLRATWFTGPNGTASGVSAPSLFGKTFISAKDTFWLFLGATALVLVLAALLERSPARREGLATGQNLIVALTAGVPTGRIQLWFFVAGSSLGGLAGVLVAHGNGVIATESFGVDLMIGLFLMLLLGGAQSMWGPVVGAAIYVGLPRWLSGTQRYSTILYGLALLVVVIVMPTGLVGGARRLVDAGAGAVRRLSRGRSG
jgi:branched-chain amino acid transport system permease protein